MIFLKHPLEIKGFVIAKTCENYASYATGTVPFHFSNIATNECYTLQSFPKPL